MPQHYRGMENFKFLENNDRELFLQWVKLRNRVFRESNSLLPEDFGQEDEYDNVSQIVIAVKDGIVAGGARLTISAPWGQRTLPLETQGFVLPSHPNTAYAEISRMAVDSRHAEGTALAIGISRKLCEIAGRGNVDTIYSICPANAARLNRFNARKCGVSFTKHEQVRATAYGLDMSLCSFSGVARVYGTRLEAA